MLVPTTLGGIQEVRIRVMCIERGEYITHSSGKQTRLNAISSREHVDGPRYVGPQCREPCQLFDGKLAPSARVKSAGKIKRGV